VFAIRPSTLLVLLAVAAAPLNGEPANRFGLTQKRQDEIMGWIVDLDADEYRRRSTAQSELEKLREAHREFAEQHLSKRPGLEYMTRRRRVLERYKLTHKLERIENELERLQKTGKSELRGLEPFVRIVGPVDNASGVFFELNRSCKNYLVTVYAAAKYAQDAVRHEIISAIPDRAHSGLQTDKTAIRWISIFLTLCDANVQMNEKKANRELTALSSVRSAAAIRLGMSDREFGPTLRLLVRKFIATAGERGERFAVSQRAALAKRLPTLAASQP